ncbi:hypothetical protein BDV37DRAFT_270399 [Aspergillus pseudonomiae]|uniref:Uncharacterized protein n=1 Tax=Aspergillus pseudonomiae TaxID=1506151 RepID=A0A5N7DHL8_9EURO|nr:uncharacterized protein BDV37DRAFT_270399 [Aspergillus pseudonomiae]KAE8405941.1 hypothetical protein BDV37DRAFT_270399 [Aspergillus pseudonomiae]
MANNLSRTPLSTLHYFLAGIYRSICAYLVPLDKITAQLFSPQNYTYNILTKLCKNPTTREEFGLDNRVKFDNYINTLDPTKTNLSLLTIYRCSRPDQFYIRWIDSKRYTLLTTVEYKPSHKLSVKNLRAGLRDINFWKKIVQPNSIPTKKSTKLAYNIAWLTRFAVTQEYYIII